MKIRQLHKTDIPAIEHLPPKDWNFDIKAFMLMHYGKEYFHPIVIELNNEIVGVANAIINKNVGWLGNIIINSNYRGRGLGKAITKHLIQHLQRAGCATQLLIATEMGKPMYEKLGFKISSYYIFLKGKKLSCIEDSKNIRKINKNDIAAILEIDREATGEYRELLLTNYLYNGWVYASSSFKIEGFYLPEFEQGLVVSKSTDAGLALLTLKHSLQESGAVIPAENKAALDFFKKHGFTEIKTAPRMYLGEKLRWNAGMIYSRASGYSG